MTKQEKRMMLKVYSLLQILKQETPREYIREEIERLSQQLWRSLED